MPDRLQQLLVAAGLDPSQPFAVVPSARLVGPDACDPSRPTLIFCEGDAPSVETLHTALRRYPPETTLILLHEEDGWVAVQLAISDLPLAGQVEAIVLDTVPPEAIQFDPRGIRGVIDRLRDPEGGCPWDLAQDHRSLRPHLLEEAYEVLAALDREDPHALREELGDLLMQIVLHAKLAEQAGTFDLDDVSEGIRDKLVRRHPHVFAAVDADTPEAVTANWEKLKAQERAADASVLDGVPRVLPALARAQSLIGRASRNGFAWPDDDSVLEKLGEELRELGAAATPDEQADEFGDVLFVLAAFARRHEINAEDALRDACEKFDQRFRAMEQQIAAGGERLQDLPLSELLSRWDTAKAAT